MAYFLAVMFSWPGMNSLPLLNLLVTIKIVLKCSGPDTGRAKIKFIQIV